MFYGFMLVNSNLSNIGNALCVPASSNNYDMYTHNIVSSGNFQSGTFFMNTSKDITANTEAFKFVTADSKSQFLPKQCNAFMISGSSQKTYPLTLINGIMTPYMGVTIPSGSYMCYYNVMRN